MGMFVLAILALVTASRAASCDSKEECNPASMDDAVSTSSVLQIGNEKYHGAQYDENSNSISVPPIQFYEICNSEWLGDRMTKSSLSIVQSVSPTRSSCPQHTTAITGEYACTMACTLLGLPITTIEKGLKAPIKTVATCDPVDDSRMGCTAFATTSG